ncbi:MAG: hypothetical protein F4X91_05720 [Nitrospinae bacterium]|nr:hypothetical protein [Nitrospinota bacterium]
MRLQGVAEEEQANVEMYAGMVVDAQQAIDDENQRVMDVASARTAAVKEVTAVPAANFVNDSGTGSTFTDLAPGRGPATRALPATTALLRSMIAPTLTWRSRVL